MSVDFDFNDCEFVFPLQQHLHSSKFTILLIFDFNGYNFDFDLIEMYLFASVDFVYNTYF